MNVSFKEEKSDLELADGDLFTLWRPLFSYLFMCLKDTDRQSSHALVHLPDAVVSQGWGSPKPGSQNSAEVPRVGTPGLRRQRCPPRVGISRKLGLEVELGPGPRHSDMSRNISAPAQALHSILGRNELGISEYWAVYCVPKNHVSHIPLMLIAIIIYFTVMCEL